jgi:hypothetical protein
LHENIFCNPFALMNNFMHWRALDVLKQVFHRDQISGPPTHSQSRRMQNWIGRSQWSADPYFKGRIDDFRIYHGA